MLPNPPQHTAPLSTVTSLVDGDLAPPPQQLSPIPSPSFSHLQATSGSSLLALHSAPRRTPHASLHVPNILQFWPSPSTSPQCLSFLPTPHVPVHLYLLIPARYSVHSSHISLPPHCRKKGERKSCAYQEDIWSSLCLFSRTLCQRRASSCSPGQRSSCPASLCMTRPGRKRDKEQVTGNSFFFFQIFLHYQVLDHVSEQLLLLDQSMFQQKVQ